MTGLRFGRLYGVSFSHRSPSGHALWLFRCDCGEEAVILGSNVRSGKTQSCGCLHRERAAQRLTSHGHRAQKRHDSSYRAWQVMKDGCTNPASPAYQRYGARGIAVCPAWRDDFSRFLTDMGTRPDGAVLALLDSTLNFGPSNCRWEQRASRADRAINGWTGRRERETVPLPHEASY